VASFWVSSLLTVGCQSVANEAVEIAAALCRRFEGFYSKPYLCPAAVATIGYGSTRYENGTRVSLADAPITRERAEALMRWELETVCLPSVNRYCHDQPANVQAALVDFVFNCGAGRLAGSTLRKRINAGDYEGAKLELAKWVRGGGKVLPGLVKRRTAESLLL
jgi:lysozyme